MKKYESYLESYYSEYNTSEDEPYEMWRKETLEKSKKRSKAINSSTY